eukprot:COSAG04_NODE_464_length_13939_cov_11.061922_15_plen_85_part_00
MERYERALAAHPLRTNMVFSGVLFLVGDVVCQALQRRGKQADGGGGGGGVSVARTVRMTFHGSCINAPLYHVFLTGLKCAERPG